jgi:hypothetical protein
MRGAGSGPEPPALVKPIGSRRRRTEALLFATLLFAYAYFAQGGGWNQNVRFAQVRAMAESRSLAINGYLSYAAKPSADGELRLVRRPLPERAALPVGFAGLVSGDVSHHEGRFHPNKPPGLQLLAVPGYALLLAIERAAGVDPDDWWAMTCNAHLSSVLSVGLLAAFGGVVFLRASRRAFPDLRETSHLAAAATLGLATLVFPFATKLIDHVAAAYLLFGAFALLAAMPAGRRGGELAPIAAGLLAGAAVLVNYTSVLGVALLGLLALLRARSVRPVARFVAGGLPAALVLAAYHQVCFGSPFHTANTYQPVSMSEAGRFLGMIGVPDPGVAWKLLFSAQRGLFFSSPVLLCAVAGFFLARGRREARAALALCASMGGVTWLVNASFNGWHGGSTFGPRYLIPALPFIAFPLALVFQRLPRVTSGLAVLSFAMMAVANAVTPQVPPRLENPYQEFLLPLLMGGSYVRGTTSVQGPVSVNPAGVYEGRGYEIFGEGTPPARWAAFNLGEVVFPGSALSLLPFLLASAAGCALAWRSAASAPIGEPAPRGAS